MEPRKFVIGDRVRLRLDSHINEYPAATYTISRALPAMANVWQYRVKRVDDGLERAVNEQQLAKATSQTAAQRSLIDLQRDAQRVRNARAAERTRVVAKRSEEDGR
jgi:hypothetical protein